MAYHLLSPSIRKYIREKGWEELRAIQYAAIERILTSDNHYILVSRTASGKTEAAFLPILSKVNFNEPGVQVLYISPLIALINDQFYRIEDLCKNLEVPVTKWHGEANKSLKDKLVKQPAGIVLITPESLEAMFVYKPFNVKGLFSNLKYVVVDEIHSFIGTDRGVQLQSLLARLQYIQSKPFFLIGLSATMSAATKFQEVKEFTGDPEKTKILVDKSKKEIKANFRYYHSNTEEIPLDLYKDLYLSTKDNKVLIFPNSRGRSEEIAVKLKKISERVNGHGNYFSHHSSLDKEARAYVEYFAKNNHKQNFSIACTSTLELGIDIGTVDLVVQIDATFSIASLIQRVGRCGRKEGQTSMLYLYATNEWSLLQSIACWRLYQEDFIEPPQVVDNPYDLLIHQALSITKGHTGIPLTTLILSLKKNAAFNKIELHDIEYIIDHLIEINLLEKLQKEVIIGIEGEKIVNSREFYSVFKTVENYKVIHAGNTIGQIPYSFQVLIDENILLAAKIWKITFIDHKAKQINVLPAADGRKPVFLSGIGAIDTEIRVKMLDTLYDDEVYDFLNQECSDELNLLRSYFSAFAIKDIATERPLRDTEKELQWFTFTGTKVNRTIQLLLNIAGIKNTLDDSNSSFLLEMSKQDFLKRWKSLPKPLVDIDSYLYELLEDHPAIMEFSKWGIHLPKNYQVRLIRSKYFDIEQTKHFLETIQLVENK